jgi:hypothetical protein
MAKSILTHYPACGAKEPTHMRIQAVVSKPSLRNSEQLDGPQASLAGIDLRQATLNMTFWATWRHHRDPSVSEPPDRRTRQQHTARQQYS